MIKINCFFSLQELKEVLKEVENDGYSLQVVIKPWLSTLSSTNREFEF